MAIQIRRGTDSEWESNKSNIIAGEPVVTTDTERLFLGTGSGGHIEVANIKALAPAYDSSVQWYEGQYCTYLGKMYVCTSDTTGTWDSNDWSVATVNTLGE